jgi:hypothetical protein
MSSLESAVIHVLTDRVADLEAELAELRRTSTTSRFVTNDDGSYEFIYNVMNVRGHIGVVVLEIEEIQNGPETGTMHIGDLHPRIQEIIYACPKKAHGFQYRPIPEPNALVNGMRLLDGTGRLNVDITGPHSATVYADIGYTIVKYHIDDSDTIIPIIEHAYANGTLYIVSTHG